MSSFICGFCIYVPVVLQSVLVAGLIFGTTTKLADGQALSTLHSFCSSGSPCTDGSNPVFGGLVQGTDGNFYGTTYSGGAFNFGTVFQITPTGTLTTLYSFCSQQNCADGSNPYGGLVQGTDGNFYGTTSLGGQNSGSGCGTAFRITPSGALTTLYVFGSQTDLSDGVNPYATMVQGTDGNFYGTTSSGGNGLGGSNAWGTLFRITPRGTLTTLYNFCSQTNCADGATPGGPLTLGSDGNFYGTTSGGGNQGGTIFKFTPTGTFTALYSFCSQSGCTDGANPEYSGLVEASDGNFYGTTINGGSWGEGTVFKIAPNGALTTVYSFNCSQAGCQNGRNPYAGLIQATDGNLYGTTLKGGGNGGDFGTVFKISLSGTLTALYSFCSQTSCTDGVSPYSPVLEGTDGNVYGTTYSGGAVPNGYGTVFSLAVGLPTSAPVAILSTTSLNFGMHQIGGAYPIPQVKLTSSGTSALVISSIQRTGANPSEFSESDNCPLDPGTLSAGSVCTITPNFTPADLGPLSAAISISDNATGSPQLIALSGTAVDFSVSAMPVSNTIKGGKAASDNVTVTPLGGNTMSVGLSVSGCPANASCTLSPSQFTLNGSTASTSTLTVKGNGKTKAGTYTLTISAKVFTVTHSTAVSLAVQ
jgi:uncharacterized repeat protein (TIGR03803 family)